MPENRTYQDRREVLKIAVREKRMRVKLSAINYKGGKCVICGYNKHYRALELHHAYGKKSFGIGDSGYTKSWENIRKELDKCVLLCANCHREVEAGIALVPPQFKNKRKFVRCGLK